MTRSPPSSVMLIRVSTVYYPFVLCSSLLFSIYVISSKLYMNASFKYTTHL